LQSLVEDGNLKQIKLCFNANDQILILLNNVNSFGKIFIERKSREVDIEVYKQNQAQQRVVSIPERSVNDVMLKLKQTIKRGLSDVKGCCILSNGKRWYQYVCITEFPFYFTIHVTACYLVCCGVGIINVVTVCCSK
jgi:hypothetical protein